MTTKMWRQGDLLIQEIQMIPEKAKGKKQKSLTILASKLSGHAHRFAEKKTCRIFRSAEDWYIDVFAESANLIHPEHGTIELPTGCYRIWRQREYTREGTRYILD